MAPIKPHRDKLGATEFLKMKSNQKIESRVVDLSDPITLSLLTDGLKRYARTFDEAWLEMPTSIAKNVQNDWDEEKSEDIAHGFIEDEYISDMLWEVMMHSVVTGMEFLCTAGVWERLRLRFPGLLPANEVSPLQEFFDHRDYIGIDELMRKWIDEADLRDQMETVLNQLTDIMQKFFKPVLQCDDPTDIDPEALQELRSEIIRINSVLCKRNFRRMDFEATHHRKLFDTAFCLAAEVGDAIANNRYCSELASALSDAGHSCPPGAVRTLGRDMDYLSWSISNLLTESAVRSLSTQYQHCTSSGILFSPDSRMARTDPSYIDWHYLVGCLENVCSIAADYMYESAGEGTVCFRFTSDQFTDLIERFHQYVQARLADEQYELPKAGDEDVRILTMLQVQLMWSLVDIDPGEPKDAHQAA